MGYRRRLLPHRRAACPDSQAPAAEPDQQRGSARQLCTVPEIVAAGRHGLEEDHARINHAQLGKLCNSSPCAYGLEKSTTFEHFIHERNKLKQLMERSLEGLSITCMFIDGTIFKGEHLIVAVGLDPSGRKVVLGLRQGATENAAVVGDLLGELRTGARLRGPAAVCDRRRQSHPQSDHELRRQEASFHPALPGAQDS